MKRLLLALILFSSLASGQLVQKDFTLTDGDLTTRDAKFKKVYTPTPADAGWAVQSNAIIPSSSAGVGDTGAVYFDSVFNASTSQIVFKFVVTQVGDASTTGRTLRWWVCPETTFAGNGYAGAWNVQTGDDLFRGYEVTNGVFPGEYFGTNFNIQVGDTIKTTVRAGTRPFLVGVGRPGGGGNDSVFSIDDATPKTLTAFRIRLEGFVRNVSVKIDDFTIDTSGGTAPPPGPSFDATPPTVTSNSRNPSGTWSTSTVGNFRATVYDSASPSTGLDSAYCWLSVNGTDYDLIYTRKCGTTKDTTFQTRDTTLGSGSHYVLWRFVDDSSNVTTTTAYSFTIGSTSQFERVVWYQPYYGQQVTIKGSNTSYGVNLVTDTPFDQITDFIWFCTYPTTDAANFYSSARLGNPGTQANDNRDWRLETTYSNDPGAYDRVYGGPIAVRESIMTKLHARGARMILDVGGAMGIGDTGWDYITADSTRCWTYCDTTAHYAFVKGYDGLNQNWEYPNTAAAWQMGIRMLRRAVTKYWGASGKLYITTSRGYNPAAVWGTAAYAGSMGLINDSVDLVIPMVYGMGGSTNQGHNSPLYVTCAGNAIDNSSLKDWLSNGLDTAKLCPLYTFEAKSSTGAYLCEPRVTNAAYATYNTIYNELQTYPASWDDGAKVPYLQYTTTTKQFRSFESAQSLAEKVAYTRGLRIPNIGIWDPNRGVVVSPLDGDNQPLATALFDAIGGIQPTPPPAAPALLDPANNSTGQSRDALTLSWATSATATLYWLQCSSDSMFVSNNVVNAATIQGLSYGLPTLNYSTRYFWRVAAGNDGGWSSFSSVRNFTTASQINGPPSRPTLVYPAYADTGIRPPVTYRWNSQDSVTYYMLSLASDTTVTSSTIGPINDTSYTVATQLSSGSYYYYSVTAYNDAGNASTYWRRFRAAINATPTTYAKPMIGQRRSTGRREQFWDYPSSIQMTHSTRSQAGTPDGAGLSLFVDGGGIENPSVIFSDGSYRELGGGSVSGQSVVNALNSLSSFSLSPALTLSSVPTLSGSRFLTSLDTSSTLLTARTLSPLVNTQLIAFADTQGVYVSPEVGKIPYFKSIDSVVSTGVDYDRLVSTADTHFVTNQYVDSVVTAARDSAIQYAIENGALDSMQRGTYSFTGTSRTLAIVDLYRNIGTAWATPVLAAATDTLTDADTRMGVHVNGDTLRILRGNGGTSNLSVNVTWKRLGTYNHPAAADTLGMDTTALRLNVRGDGILWASYTDTVNFWPDTSNADLDLAQLTGQGANRNPKWDSTYGGGYPGSPRKIVRFERGSSSTTYDLLAADSLAKYMHGSADPSWSAQWVAQLDSGWTQYGTYQYMPFFAFGEAGDAATYSMLYSTVYYTGAELIWNVGYRGDGVGGAAITEAAIVRSTYDTSALKTNLHVFTVYRHADSIKMMIDTVVCRADTMAGPASLYQLNTFSVGALRAGSTSTSVVNQWGLTGKMAEFGFYEGTPSWTRLWRNIRTLKGRYNIP